ncbi:hypothetical protein BaRGS_00004146 [Batillaria attramentaria]|uniref:PH domain-containing protein n=1 Tax=Batillaria attramentaria TaxID=370345 RepID=A0ABD0LZK5_9CAEN
METSCASQNLVHDTGVDVEMMESDDLDKLLHKAVTVSQVNLPLAAIDREIDDIASSYCEDPTIRSTVGIDDDVMKLIERTRQRRELLNQKMGKTPEAAPRKRRTPLMEDLTDNVNKQNSGEQPSEDSPKRQCVRDDENQMKPDTPAIPSVRSRLQNLASQRSGWSDVPMRPKTPLYLCQGRVCHPHLMRGRRQKSRRTLCFGSSRKSRFAQLAQSINNWEDDLSHPTIVKEEEKKPRWQPPKPVSAPKAEELSSAKKGPAPPPPTSSSLPASKLASPKKVSAPAPPQPAAAPADKTPIRSASRAGFNSSPKPFKPYEEKSVKVSPVKSPACSKSNLAGAKDEEKGKEEVSKPAAQSTEVERRGLQTPQTVAKPANRPLSARLANWEQKISESSSKPDVSATPKSGFAASAHVSQTPKQACTPARPLNTPARPLNTPAQDVPEVQMRPKVRKSVDDEPTAHSVSARMSAWEVMSSANVVSDIKKVRPGDCTPIKTPGPKMPAGKSPAKPAASSAVKPPLGTTPGKSTTTAQGGKSFQDAIKDRASQVNPGTAASSTSPGKGLKVSPTKASPAMKSVQQRLLEQTQSVDMAQRLRQERMAELQAIQNRWKNGILRDDEEVPEEEPPKPEPATKTGKKEIIREKARADGEASREDDMEVDECNTIVVDKNENVAAQNSTIVPADNTETVTEDICTPAKVNDDDRSMVKAEKSETEPAGKQDTVHSDKPETLHADNPETVHTDNPEIVNTDKTENEHADKSETISVDERENEQADKGIEQQVERSAPENFENKLACMGFDVSDEGKKKSNGAQTPPKTAGSKTCRKVKFDDSFDSEDSEASMPKKQAMQQAGSSKPANPQEDNRNKPVITQKDDMPESDTTEVTEDDSEFEVTLRRPRPDGSRKVIVRPETCDDDDLSLSAFVPASVRRQSILPSPKRAGQQAQNLDTSLDSVDSFEGAPGAPPDMHKSTVDLVRLGKQHAAADSSSSLSSQSTVDSSSDLRKAPRRSGYSPDETEDSVDDRDAIGDLLDEAMDSDSEDQPTVSGKPPVPVTRKRHSHMMATRESSVKEGDLPFSLSSYRANRNSQIAEVKQTIVRNSQYAGMRIEEEEVEMPRQQPAPVSRQTIQERIRELQELIQQEQNVIMQTSNALNQCCSNNSYFAGSAEQVECNRLLLIACQKRQSYMTEIQRLRDTGCLDNSGSGPKGSLTISDIRLPLKKEFVTKIGTSHDNTTYYFILLLRNGPQLIVTQMLSTHDPMMRGSLDFPNLIKINGITGSFKLNLEIYCMSVSREPTGKDKKKKTPKKVKGSSMTGTAYLGMVETLQSPGGPMAVHTTSFTQVTSVPLTMKSLDKNSFQLERLSYLSPLHGTIYMNLKCIMEASVEEKGFLTMFEDVSGLGSWHRRWCVLGGNKLSFWKYPDDEMRKDPMGYIDLKRCITEKVGLIARDICARPHTFELMSVRQPRKGERDTLISRTYNTMTTIRHMLSADTKEERIMWCNKLNRALANIRTWNTDAMRPISK